MKKFALLFVFSLLLVNIAAAASPECGTTAVLGGCVGDTDLNPTCVQRYEATYTVTAADVDASPGNNARFCLEPVSSSLCGNTSAIATVSRNGRNAQTADLNDDGQVRINAKEGDVIRVVVEQVPRKSNIQCFRQGEVVFELVR